MRRKIIFGKRDIYKNGGEKCHDIVSSIVGKLMIGMILYIRTTPVSVKCRPSAARKFGAW